MEIKEIAIGGIDRHTPAQDAPNGVCEELINVRSDAMGLHVYKEGTAISGELDLTGIHLHRWGGRTYYIGINPQSRVVRFSLDGTTEQTLQWVSSAGNVDIKSIGNMLVVSDKGEDGKHPETRTYVLEELDGEATYKPLDRGLVLPGMSREDILVKPFSQMGSTYRNAIVPYDPEPGEAVRTPARNVFPFIHYVGDASEWNPFKESVKDTLRGAMNRVAALDKHISYGYVLVGTSITLYDGTETAFGNLMVVDLSPKTPYRDSGNLPSLWQFKRSTNHYTRVLPMKDSLDGIFIHYLSDDQKAYFDLFPDSGDIGGTTQTSSIFSGLSPKITLAEVDEDLKEYIKSVNLWVSRPYDKIDWDSFDLKIGAVQGTGDNATFVPAEVGAGVSIWSLLDDSRNFLYPMAHIRRMSECKDGLHKQLLFKQKEWTVSEIEEKGGSVTFDCEFGTSEGTLGDTLSVDAWNSKRAGTMFVYNNRIHMFDSVVEVEVPDSDLQALSNWDDEWYLSQSINDTASGNYWHMKYAPDYDAREEEGGIRDISLTEAARLTTRKGAIGLYYDSSPNASDSASSYTWYYSYPRPKESSKYTWMLYPRTSSTSAHVQYVYLSMDGQTLTHDTGRAKYMALSTNNSADDIASQLPWYNVPVEEREEATLRYYRDCTVIAYLKAEGKTLTIRHENIPVLFRYALSAGGTPTMGDVANLSGFLTYPDSRCEKLVIQFSEGGYTYGWETPMTAEDSSYNFSYAYVAEGSAEFSATTANQDQTDAVYQEEDTVVVSSLNNPTVFPVEQSYRFVGAVTGMALALEELKSTEQGTAPVYVLTGRGVFAMVQGTGGVLYSNIKPINTDNCVKGKSVQVRNGIAYYANRRLYWLIGRKRVDILLPLDGDPDLAPRSNTSYPLACQGTLYDVTGLLSNTRLEDYMDGCVLGYDSYHDELLVSNESYGYTYVFNFGAERWFKISGSYGSMDDHHLLVRSAGGSTSEESHARGSLTVGLLAVEAGARMAYNWVAGTPEDLSRRFSAGERLTLRLGTTEVASMTLQANATLPAAMSLLTQNLSWMESDVITVGGALQSVFYIYSAGSLSGRPLTLSGGAEDILFTLTESQGTAATQAKVAGSVATFRLEDGTGAVVLTATATLSLDTTIGGLCRWMASTVNAAAIPLTASIEGNKVVFEARQAGYIYNGWEASLTLSDPLQRTVDQNIYISVTSQATSGGSDIQPITPTSGAIRILDMTSEREEGDQTIHIQTRPMKLTPMAFGVIQRAIARVRATLSGSENLSVYTFTSDNLEDYKCSEAQQRANATIDRIRLERTAHGRKYTVLVIGGVVSPKTELSTILFQVKANAPKKMR